jgi:type VI secretion system secreted protein Hcp
MRGFAFGLVGFVVFSWLGTETSTFAGTGAFLNIPNIAGESQDQAHPGEIEVQGWRWDFSRSTNILEGGKPKIEVVFSKQFDSSTPKLMQALCTGSRLESVTLTLRRGDMSATTLVEIVLTGVTVGDLATTMTLTRDRPEEQFRLRFQKAQVTYFARTASEQAGNFTRYSWDLARNTGTVTDGLTVRLAFTNGGKTGLLSWPARAGITYVVEFSGSLSQPFQTLGKYAATTNGALSVEVPTSSVVGFFRVRDSQL